MKGVLIMKENCRKYLVEFIGTFFLVFTVGCCVLFNMPGVIPAIAIGGALMIMVYAGGPVSGGHYNPAVSLAAVVRGALPVSELLPYWIAQILGAVAAALLMLQMVVPPMFTNAVNYESIGLIIGEFLFTFALCYVVLFTATSPDTQGNSYFGLAIGSTVTTGIFAVGSAICYGAFNPAVAIGLGTLQIADWPSILLTILANLLGGFAAAFAYKFVKQ